MSNRLTAKKKFDSFQGRKGWSKNPKKRQIKRGFAKKAERNAEERQGKPRHEGRARGFLYLREPL